LIVIEILLARLEADTFIGDGTANHDGGADTDTCLQGEAANNYEALKQRVSGERKSGG
jgi:hypothetical protein